MRADEFLVRLQQVRDGKQLVDLLVQASIVAPPMKAPWQPMSGTKVAPMNNTPWVAAGTHGAVSNTGGSYYNVTWANGKVETIYKEQHDYYNLVYVY
jgi:hypothetical protein